MEMCYSSSMRLQKQFISTFMCVASFKKTVWKGLGNVPTRGICITDALLAHIVFTNYEKIIIVETFSPNSSSNNMKDRKCKRFCLDEL